MSSNIMINKGIIKGNVIQKGDNIDSASTGTEGSVKSSPLSSYEKDFEYDVAISYSSAETGYVSRVVKILKAEGLRVFFAPDCEEEFMAQNMIAQFYKIYRYKSMFVAAFISKSYIDRDITMHEVSTALLREKDEKRNCLIPVYMDGSRLEKLDTDINYIAVKRNGNILREVETADKIIRIIKNYAGSEKNE